MSRSRVLVVEGADDKHVMYALVMHHKFQPEFDIEDAKGLSRLLNGLPALLTVFSRKERVGVIVDADTDIRSRWASIRTILVDAGYVNIPDEPDPTGTVIADEFLPWVGIWIMPDNNLPGMLEDYLTHLLPLEDSLLNRANRVLDEIPLEERRFPARHRQKALIHTWLAWQESPGSPLGLAITQHYFSANSPQVDNLLAWLTRLFA